MVLQYLLRIKYFQLNAFLLKLLLSGFYVEITAKITHSSKDVGAHKSIINVKNGTWSIITHQGHTTLIHTQMAKSLKEMDSTEHKMAIIKIKIHVAPSSDFY